MLGFLSSETSDRSDCQRKASANGVRVLSPASANAPVFWPTYWLAIALIIIKAWHFGLPDSTHPARIWAYAWQILIATAIDNLFALGMGLLAASILALLHRHRRIQRGVWMIWILASVGCVVYAIISAYVFNCTHMPITRALLRSGGAWSDMKSSVGSYITVFSAVTVIGGTLTYMLMAWLSHRTIGLPRIGVVRAVTGTLAIAVLGQFAYAQSQVGQRQWARRDDHRIALNPHWTLLATCLFRTQDEKPAIPTDIPPSFDDEFRPIRDRSAVAPSAGPFFGSPAPKHVIVYVLESTSIQFLHLYGSHFPTTPNLDIEAGHSLIFDNIYCQVGQTPSSLVGINSSNYARPSWNPNPNMPEHSLRQPGTLISEVLKNRGYRTLAVTASDFNFSHQRDFLEGRGFDQIRDEHDLPGSELMSWGKADGLMVDQLLNWIDQDTSHSKPFFALCWTNQTHHPYAMSVGAAEQPMLGDFHPPAPANPADINRYLNILLEEDRQIERLLTALRQRGLADDTLLVITGDHGEGFNWPHESFSHGFRLYEENLHVPCLFLNPRLFPTATRLSVVGNQIDLAPTITTLLGIPPAGNWQGHSLLDPARPNRAYFYGSLDDYLLGVRDGDWKYVFNASTGFGELYNLHDDPGELKDVYAAHPEICKDLRARTGAWESHLDVHGAGVAP